jgi:hypothetical protein
MAFAFDHLAGNRIVSDLGPGDGRHRVIRGDFKLPFAQRCLANVQFQIRGNASVGLRHLIDGHLGHPHLRQHLVRPDGVSIVRRRKPIDKHLPQRLVHTTGKLAGRKLDQPLRIRHLDPDRALVRHPQPAAVAERTLRDHPQRLRPNRKATKRGLGLDHDTATALDGTAQLHLKTAVRPVLDD